MIRPFWIRLRRTQAEALQVSTQAIRLAAFVLSCCVPEAPRFDTPAKLEAALRQAGFVDIHITSEEADFVYTQDEDWWISLWAAGQRRRLERLEATVLDQVKADMLYASGQALHEPGHPGKQPIQPSKRVAVLACMAARLDVEDLLGLQTGDAHIIRNAGGVVTDDAIRCLIISHHLLNTNEIILIHHTRCGVLAFTDDLLKAGLEGDPAAEKLPGQATGRAFTSCKKCAAMPSQFHAFRGPIEPLDAPREAKQTERLAWDVRRGMFSILNHPWIPTSGPDAVTVRGFIYDVDTGKLEEVSYPGSMGSIG